MKGSRVEKHQNVTFENQTVELDGSSFVACTFRDCVLAFRGSAPTGIQNCGMIRCRWQFEDAAAITLSFVREMHNSLGGADDFIGMIFGSPAA